MSNPAAIASRHQFLLNEVRAALFSDRRIGRLARGIELTLDGGVLRLEGQVPSVEAKRRALINATSRLSGGIAVADLLRVRPFVQMAEQDALEAVCHELVADPALQQCGVSCWSGGLTRHVRRPAGLVRGNICVSVSRGIIRLDGVVPSHLERRVAEVMAWWCLGARDVDNALVVHPDQIDDDEGLRDALSYVLTNEPLLYGCAIEVTVRAGEVTLSGKAIDGPAREIAEFDTWFVPGVIDVHNELVPSMSALA